MDFQKGKKLKCLNNAFGEHSCFTVFPLFILKNSHSLWTIHLSICLVSL